MGQFQSQKATARALHRALDLGDDKAAAELLGDDCIWHGMHPFNDKLGASSVLADFWHPLHGALSRLQRREDIFFAGLNEMDGENSVWVVSMGHLMGLFDAPWCGIRPTGKMAFLRYCSFDRVEVGRVVETAMFFDIPHLMIQAGFNPFPPETATHLVQPGPITHDGLLHDAQPTEVGAATLASINAMITDLGQWKLGIPLEEELARSWVDDMIWWGPAGIGATYTIARYAKQHSAPFRAGLTDRSPTTHIARLAEGHYGGFFGWPNFTATPSGGFMGMPATGKPGEFRVVDIYRRAGDKLAENWVFIDLLHFWKTQGVDVLQRAVSI